MAEQTSRSATALREQALAEVETSIRGGKPLARLPAGLERGDVIRFIAAYLGETDPTPLEHIALRVDELDACRAINLLRVVDRIESKKGVYLKALGRRRTRGGVWFWLAREQVRLLNEQAAEKAETDARPPRSGIEIAKLPSASMRDKAKGFESGRPVAQAERPAEKARATSPKHRGNVASQAATPAVEVFVMRRRP